MPLNYAKTGQWKISPPHFLVGKPLRLITLWFAGRFITQRHNELRDLEAEFSSMVCSDVAIEPVLQDKSGKHLKRRSNKAQEARLDIHARGFSERHWSAFFDVRICHPYAVSYRDPESQKIYRIHENEKKRLYCKRVLDIEHRIFTPLVFTTTGGMGKESFMYPSRLAQLIAKEKKEKITLVLLNHVFGVLIRGPF